MVCMMIVSVLMTATRQRAHEDRVKDREATGGAGERGCRFCREATKLGEPFRP
jgi:hypothetical protein